MVNCIVIGNSLVNCRHASRCNIHLFDQNHIPGPLRVPVCIPMFSSGEGCPGYSSGPPVGHCGGGQFGLD